MYGSVHRVRPLHLNLASKPFRDYRGVYAVVAATFALSALLMIVNVRTGYYYYVSTRETRGEIAAIEAEARQERARAKELETQLRGVDTGRLAIETTFINAQIAQRAFSWTLMLDTLERIVPRNVRVLHLSPTVKPNGETRLSMGFAAKNSGGMVELLNRLFADDRFSRPFPSGESTNDSGEQQFQITVDYDPARGSIQ